MDDDTSVYFSKCLFIDPSNGIKYMRWGAKRLITDLIEHNGPDIANILVDLRHRAQFPPTATDPIVKNIWKWHARISMNALPPHYRAKGWKNYSRKAFLHFANGDEVLATKMYQIEHDLIASEWQSNKDQIIRIKQKYDKRFNRSLYDSADGIATMLHKPSPRTKRKRPWQDQLYDSSVGDDDFNSAGACADQINSISSSVVILNQPTSYHHTMNLDLSHSVYEHPTGKWRVLTWAAKRAMTNAMEMVGPHMKDVLRLLQNDYNFPISVTPETLGISWRSHVDASTRSFIPRSTWNKKFRPVFLYFANVGDGNDISAAREFFKNEQQSFERDWQLNKDQIKRIKEKYLYKCSNTAADNFNSTEDNNNNNDETTDEELEIGEDYDWLIGE